MDVSQIVALAWVALVFWVLGQIWLVQVVVYPLFARVGAAEYIPYHRFYLQRIPLPVIGPGFACFLMPILLALFGPAVPTWMNVANIVAGLIGLLVTALLEIPRHNRLQEGGKDDTTIAELIRYNWPRTLSISVQAVVTVLMLRSLLVSS